MKWSIIISFLVITLFGNTSGFAQIAIGENGQFSFALLAEEEKLARDVYVTLGEKWDVQIFQNTQQAEQKHLQEVIKLFEQRGLDLPESIVKDEKGVFSNPEIQKLYDNLIAEGSNSLVDALKVGALIEEMDITDLEAGLAVEIDEKETTLLNKLLKASQNHLRAFNKNLQKKGVDYVPAIMSQDAFNAVIQSNNGAMKCEEKGTKMGACGKGKGKKAKGQCCKASK